MLQQQFGRHFVHVTSCSKVQLVELHGTSRGDKASQGCHETSCSAYAACPCYRIKSWANQRQRPEFFVLVHRYEGLNGVDWQLTNGKEINCQLTNTRKFNWQLIFVVRFTDNWQKALAIAVPLKFIKNKIFVRNIITLTFSVEIHAVCIVFRPKPPHWVFY